MMVRVLVGRDAGAVRDIRAAEAHAMLQDGRALPADMPFPPAATPVISTTVASRNDRGMPRSKRRAVR